MLVFHFRAKDLTSDRGIADVAITATTLTDACYELKRLIANKNRSDLETQFEHVKTLCFTYGVVFENIEPTLGESNDDRRIS